MISSVFFAFFLLMLDGQDKPVANKPDSNEIVQQIGEAEARLAKTEFGRLMAEAEKECQGLYRPAGNLFFGVEKSHSVQIQRCMDLAAGRIGVGHREGLKEWQRLQALRAKLREKKKEKP